MDPTTATATMIAARDRRDDWSWHWLLDRLRDYVTLRGMRPEDEEALKGVYVDPVFHRDPRGEVGPDVDIMTMFRENASLWQQANPAGEHVVTVPRELLKAVLDCVPPNGLMAAPQLSVMEDMGKLLLERAASGHRGVREDLERHQGEAMREEMLRWIDEAQRRHCTSTGEGNSATDT
jgi:hypothetical protein